MVLLGDKGELILLISQGKGSRVHHNIVCFGARRHYRKDGTCKHTEALLGGMRPWGFMRPTGQRSGTLWISCSRH